MTLVIEWIRAWADADVELVPFAGGANNRVYEVRTATGKYFLKHYFSNASGDTTRLDAEFGFLSVLYPYATRFLPKPMVCNKDLNVAVYSHLGGHQVESGGLTLALVNQAVEFVRVINLYDARKKAVLLKDAVEACFSMSEHLDVTQRRINRLKKLEATSGVYMEMTDWLNHDLEVVWDRIKNDCLGHFNNRKQLHDKLLQQERCISPSDFGFHNAFVDVNGKIKFYDFEYAGWDDPVKLVCDFFCQPQVPVSLKYLDEFIEQIQKGLELDDDFRYKVELLMPVYQIKWCCLLLNEFLPQGRVRRVFARKEMLGDAGIRKQFEKAKKKLLLV